MAKENDKLNEFEELWMKGLFIDLGKKEGKIVNLFFSVLSTGNIGAGKLFFGC